MQGKSEIFSRKSKVESKKSKVERQKTPPYKEGFVVGLAVRLIVLLTADFPVPCEHGLFAVGLVLLRGEGDLVVGDLREILLTRLDHRGYRGEACSDLQLFRAERRGALLRGTEVQTVTLVVGRCRYAVGSQEHLLARVLSALTGFCQCAGYMIDSGRISYICHSCSAFADQPSAISYQLSAVSLHAVGGVKG